MTETTLDRQWMRRAVQQAAHGYPMPNPRVGCVLAQGARFISEGYHHHWGGPHAEAVALVHAGDEARGATAYVTLEPCNHHGRTPPCAEALIRAGVARVVTGITDPNPIAAGGLARLREAGIDVVTGVLTEACERVNLAWLTAVRRGWPFVTVKAAITRDGFMAPVGGGQHWITGRAARSAGRRLRAEMGAVLVGRGTVESDNPLLTARTRNVVNPPVRIVLDPRGQLSGTERVFGPNAPTWCVNTEWEVARDETGHLDLLALLRQFYGRGLRGLLVEGGPTSIHHFLQAGLVDRIVLFIAPTMWGEGVPWTGISLEDEAAGRTLPGGWTLTGSRSVGQDVMVELDRQVQIAP